MYYVIESSSHSLHFDGCGGLHLSLDGKTVAYSAQPVEFEILRGDIPIAGKAAYESLSYSLDGGILAIAEVSERGSRFRVADIWRPAAVGFILDRKVNVEQGDGSPFSTGFSMRVTALPGKAAKVFAPGMLYGDPECVNVAAFGSRESLDAGVSDFLIREDRFPAPIIGVFAEGRGVCLLDPKPDGRTSWEDGSDSHAVEVMVSEKIRVASLGVDLSGQETGVRVSFPGSEGGITYLGNTYPGGQVRKWRRRYHPCRSGFETGYSLQIFSLVNSSYADFMRDAWRMAWSVLKPRVEIIDIKSAEESLVRMLFDTVLRKDGRVGVPLWVDASSRSVQPDNKTQMGWVGRGIESAYFLLRLGDSRQQAAGREILDTFVDLLAVSPPNGEGYEVETGEPSMHWPGQVHLRSLCEGGRHMLLAYVHEKNAGAEMRHWQHWAFKLGTWIARQELKEGGFPSCWYPATGDVRTSHSQASYNAIPFFVELWRTSGDDSWLDLATKTSDFCWESLHRAGKFVGGTLDNPNVTDKEAGTVSLEGYLALFEATQDRKYLERARLAADFSESWIYLWNVPMPESTDGSALPWKRSQSTIGLQLIATGHSLVDTYMAFDVGSYARLWKYTGDDHYLQVARLLLHNTKSMLALPGRCFDLLGPGWQQEHWSLAPPRGKGLHRGWLPWVTVSHLTGIVSLRDLDATLFEHLTSDWD